MDEYPIEEKPKASTSKPDLEKIKLDPISKSNWKSGKPDPEKVLEAVKDLPTSGILAQDGYSGKLFLDLDDEWVFKALPVIKDYGYISPPFFVFPPVPLGAHIRIITENEAVDHELVTEREGKKEIPGLGKTVNFKVVEAFSHHPEIRTYGIESRYWIRVESEELDKIRMDLTGLPRPELGFCINVGVKWSKTLARMNDMPDESEEKPVETELTQSPPSSTSGDPQSSQCPVCLDSFVEIRDNGSFLASTTCGHVFCGPCLTSAIGQNGKCPTCRERVSSKNWHW